MTKIRSGLRGLPRRAIAMVIAFVLVVPALFGAGYGVGQLWQLSQATEPGAPFGYPTALLKAADALSGASYKFTVEQLRAPMTTPTPSVSANPTSTPAPEPSGDATPPGSTEGFNHFVTVGATDGVSFWQTVYALPLSAPISDYAKGELQFSYLSTPDGGSWRDDGSGWFRYTGIAPGEGFDPVSAAHLPDLLRHLQNVTSETADAPHAGLTGYGGQIDPIDYPGVVTSDGLPNTAAPVIVLVWLDSSGRLARLEATTANLDANQELVVSLLFEYGDIGSAPEPSPLASLPPVGPDGIPLPTDSVQP